MTTPAVHLPPGQHRECFDCGDDAVSRWNNRCYCLSCLDIAQATSQETGESRTKPKKSEDIMPDPTTSDKPGAMRKCPQCGKGRAKRDFSEGVEACRYCRMVSGRKAPKVAKAPRPRAEVLRVTTATTGPQETTLAVQALPAGIKPSVFHRALADALEKYGL